MREIKDTKRAEVHIGFDGRVHKRYKGPLAKQRFENEVRILKYLDAVGCTFVPKLLEFDQEQLYIVTTNCGQLAPKISEEKVSQMFKALEQYGVRHEDAFARNITYNSHKGCFCVIDFEFSTNLETGEGLTIEDAEEYMRQQREAEKNG
jgi:tRNA A-37 threonylcarbamoyl transferase component Bud32